MLFNILLVVIFIAALLLVCRLCYLNFLRNQFTITHIDNTHVELHNAARNQTIRVTLLAIMDEPLQSDRLACRYRYRQVSQGYTFLRATSAVRNGRCSAHIPANAERVQVRAVASRREVRLWLEYRQSLLGVNRRILIDQTFTF